MLSSFMLLWPVASVPNHASCTAEATRTGNTRCRDGVNETG